MPAKDKSKYKSFFVRMVRQSGLPVEPEALIERRKAFDDLMSKLEAEHGKCTSDNSYKFQAELEKLEAELEAKHPTLVEINMPRTGKQWDKMISRYGAIAVIKVEDKITLLIIDNQKA